MFCWHSLVIYKLQSIETPLFIGSRLYLQFVKLGIAELFWRSAGSHGVGYWMPRAQKWLGILRNNRPKTRKKIHLLVFSGEPIISPPLAVLRTEIPWILDPEVSVCGVGRGVQKRDESSIFKRFESETWLWPKQQR
jgi:hypothetical protein